MKISLDLNPQDLFGKDAPFAPNWQKAPSSEEGNPLGTLGPLKTKEHYPRPLTVAMALLLLVSFFGLIESAQYSVAGKFLTPDLLRGPTYGPAFHKGHYFFKYVDFSQTGKSFAHNIPLWRLSELPYNDLRKMILDATPVRMRERLDQYIDYAFFYAQTYQVDPLWVISIMWVESHFKPQVKSHVDAMGLMQIMPGTAHYLNHLLDRPLTPKLAIELSKDPAHNIQLGTYYLGRLLNRFKGNHVYATVSYNMGPGFTLRRLRMGRPVGTRNHYLDKVRRAYKRLSSQVRQELADRPPLHTQTLASIYQMNTLPGPGFRLVSWWNSETEDLAGRISQVDTVELKFSGVVRL